MQKLIMLHFSRNHALMRTEVQKALVHLNISACFVSQSLYIKLREINAMMKPFIRLNVKMQQVRYSFGKDRLINTRIINVYRLIDT